MFMLPGETRDEYAARYRKGWESERDRMRMGTKAMSGGKDPFDISRDNESYFIIDEPDEDTRAEDDENYYGRWITGFGFFNVQFPKATSRELTDEEWEWFLDHPVVMA